MEVRPQKRNLGRGEGKSPMPEGWEGLIPGMHPDGLRGLRCCVSSAKRKGRGGEGTGDRP